MFILIIKEINLYKIGFIKDMLIVIEFNVYGKC